MRRCGWLAASSTISSDLVNAAVQIFPGRTGALSQIRHAKKPHEVTNRSAQDGADRLSYLKQIKE
jgi:hypothetical protein